MIYLYFISSIPIVIGLVFLCSSKEVVWWEWVAGSLIALATCGVVHFAAVRAQTHDVETWSGIVLSVRNQPSWVEEYQTAVYTTDSKGNSTFSHYETHYTTHPECWMATSSIWSTEHNISQSRFYQIVKSWGNLRPERGNRPGYHSGDRNDYVASYNGQYTWPITDLRSWSNRLKCSPSVFDFVKVSDADAIGMGLYHWPENKDVWNSSRLLGDNGDMTVRAMDLLNSRIGPKKEANLIFIGFGDKPQSTATYQQAYWHGGKKNDIVVCHGSGWVYAFGWAYDNTVFRDIETSVLEYVNDRGKLDDGVLAKVEPIIFQKYQRKNWADFSYISVTPPTWSYFVLVLIMAITQTAFWICAHRNNY